MGTKGKPIHRYTEEEERWLKDCVLPQHKDADGLKKLAEVFKERFGEGEARSPRALYLKIANLQGRYEKTEGKPRRRKKMPKSVKHHVYTPEEEYWLRNYKLPKGNKRGMSKLSRVFNKQFGIKVSGQAIYWKAKNLKGEWVRRAAAERESREFYTSSQEDFLLQKANEVGLEELTPLYNSTFSQNRTYQAIRIKLNKLRRRERAAKKEVVSGKMSQRYTEKQDNFLLVGDVSSGSYKKLTDFFNRNFGENRSVGAIRERVRRLKEKGMTGEKTIEKLLHKKIFADPLAKSTSIKVAATPVEYIVMDGDNVIWRGDTEPNVVFSLEINGKFICSYGINAVPKNIVVFKRTK